jgi:hypothetical protein
MKNSEQPAFPVSKELAESSEIEGYPYGLTKREYFVAKAMQGFISCQQPGFKFSPEEIALRSIECADELLKQLGE